MKALVLLVAITFMGNVWAAMSSTPTVAPPPLKVSYTCSQYTRNQVMEDRSTTDHPALAGVTKVNKTTMGFDVKAGVVFPHDKVLTNAQLGSLGVMAGDPETLLLKKEDDSGYPYFVIYQFDKTKVDGKGNPTNGAIVGMVVLGNCNTD